MKINQVEELTGITKKNIRFYESEGLIAPGRDPANGYREYDLENVRALLGIKLLRKLDVSCEKIRELQEGPQAEGSGPYAGDVPPAHGRRK